MRHLLVAVALLASAAPCRAADAPQSVRYVVVTVGRPAGEQVVRTTANGEIDATYEFNDRGRGPKLASHIVVGPASIPTRVETTGNDYLKNAVDEHFAVADGKASWSNASERGDAPVDAAARAFYVSQTGLPIEGALLARALLAAPGNR